MASRGAVLLRAVDDLRGKVVGHRALADLMLRADDAHSVVDGDRVFALAILEAHSEAHEDGREGGLGLSILLAKMELGPLLALLCAV